jgi:hypothetical protein
MAREEDEDGGRGGDELRAQPERDCAENSRAGGVGRGSKEESLFTPPQLNKRKWKRWGGLYSLKMDIASMHCGCYRENVGRISISIWKNDKMTKNHTDGKSSKYHDMICSIRYVYKENKLIYIKSPLFHMYGLWLNMSRQQTRENKNLFLRHMVICT